MDPGLSEDLESDESGRGLCLGILFMLVRLGFVVAASVAAYAVNQAKSGRRPPPKNLGFCSNCIFFLSLFFVEIRTGGGGDHDV